MIRYYSQSVQGTLLKGIAFAGGFVWCSFLASTGGADDTAYEYGTESAIWVHDAPKETKVEKTLFVIPDGDEKGKARVKVKLKASSKGPEADLPGSPPRRVAVSFKGEASIAAGDFRVNSHRQFLDADSPANGMQHTSRLMRHLGGGQMQKYILGDIVPVGTGDVSLEEVETQKSAPIIGRETRILRSYIVSSEAGLGVVEYDINLLLGGVVTDAANRPVPSAGAALEGTFTWELVVASRVWKRNRASAGKKPGEWIPAWEKGAVNDGWIIPPSEKAVTKAKDG